MNRRITDWKGSTIGNVRKTNMGEVITNEKGHVLGFTSDRGGTFSSNGSRVSPQSEPGLLFGCAKKPKK